MNWLPPEVVPVGERMNSLWNQGVRLVTRAAIAFALATAAAIGVGAAVTDHALVQILVTVMAALAFWIPSFFIVRGVDKWLARRGTHHGDARQGARSPDDQVWRRFFAAAPGETQRIAVLKRSLERSRLTLGSAALDPDAHDLCILIDRRLPDLIHHELEILPPDDRHRREKVRELIDLVEQFARHCSRKGFADGPEAEFQAEVLRRRFEARLSEFYARVCPVNPGGQVRLLAQRNTTNHTATITTVSTARRSATVFRGVFPGVSICKPPDKLAVCRGNSR